MTLSDESDTESLALHEAEWAQREAFDEVFRYLEVEKSIAQKYEELALLSNQRDACYKRESRKLRDAIRERDKVEWQFRCFCVKKK